MFFGILLLGCNSKQSNKRESFIRLIDQLPALKTPLIFNSAEEINVTIIRDRNKDFIRQINALVPGFNGYGKIYESENYIAVIEIVPADIATPMLFTYNKQGIKIDSLFMYPTAGESMGYYSTNKVTLTENKMIFITDSTLTRKINEAGTDEVEGTDSLSVTEKRYIITAKGKIELTSDPAPKSST